MSNCGLKQEQLTERVMNKSGFRTISTGLEGVSLRLASSSNEFSRGCKFADGLSMLTNMQDILRQNFDDGTASPM